MKIGIVCYPTFGGSGVVATELGIELSNKGHEVHFITYSQPVRLEALTSNLHFHEVTVPEYPLFKYEPYELALSSKLYDVISKHNLDLIHVHYAIPHAYAGYMAKQMLKDNGYNIPIITTLHGTDITLVGNHPFYKPAVTFSINNSDIVTCVSKSLKDDTIDFFKIKREIKVIPNFIDIKKYNEKHKSCEKNVISKGDEKIIIHINAGATQLVINKAKEYIRKNDLKNNVIFLGNTSQVDEILCSSDIFILPSEKESFGLSALEAMALKVPIISTNIGGLKELNIDNNFGYTSDVGDTGKMAKDSIKILSDSKLQQKFRDNAFENAKKFDIKNIIPLYEDLYKKAIK